MQQTIPNDTPITWNDHGRQRRGVIIAHVPVHGDINIHVPTGTPLQRRKFDGNRFCNRRYLVASIVYTQGDRKTNYYALHASVVERGNTQ